MSRIVLKRQWLYLPVLTYLIAAIGFAVFYLVQRHDALLRWFFSLNDCFYRRGNFVQQLFTPSTKTHGNSWCVFTIAAAAMLLALLLHSWRQSQPPVVIHLPDHLLKKSLPYLLLLALCICLWGYATALFSPVTDEVFSAVHCATLHPFQCLSYYMSPNNHLLFNLFNNITTPATADKVTTGRVLSLIAYAGFVLSVYHWLQQGVMPRLSAFITALALAMQLPVWGYGAQARGYECCLLASWISFIALYNYSLQSGGLGYLRVYALGTCAGYMLMPTFLYFGIALIAFAGVVQLLRRRVDGRFWKYTAAGYVLVLCFYLPVLCFSGIASFAENKYVVADARPMADFLKDFYGTFGYYYDCFFWGANYSGGWGNLLLFLFPFLLLLRKRWLYYGLFYGLMWGVYIAIALVMKRYGYSRNLIGQLSISLGMVLLTLYAMLLELKQYLKAFPARIVFMACALLICGFFIATFKAGAAFSMYSFDVNQTYAADEAALSIIPAGSTVGLSDADFMYCYILRRKGCMADRCHLSDEQYLVFHQEEVVPPALLHHYQLIDHRGEFNFYRRMP